MNNLIFTDRNGTKYKRIDKRIARRLYDDNKTIVLCGDNLRPFNEFFPFYISINKKSINELRQKQVDFNRIVSEYEYYNCINNQTGYKSAFYTAID